MAIKLEQQQEELVEKPSRICTSTKTLLDYVESHIKVIDVNIINKLKISDHKTSVYKFQVRKICKKRL